MVAPAAGVLIFVMSAWNLAGQVMTGKGQYFGGDFAAFYSAGRMALRGDARLSYDLKAFGEEVARYDPEDANKLLWSYPPTMFLVVAPFALPPILMASVLWTALSLLLFLYTVFRIYPHWSVLGLVLGSPSFIKIVVYGQASLLFAAALGIGLLSLSRERGARGGAILSCATLKPHLSLFIPVFLLVEKDYRALAAFVIVPLVALLAALGIFGLDSLSGFLGGLFGKTIPYLYERLNFKIMASPYAALRLWGVPQELAMYGHVLIAGLLVGGSVCLLRARAPLLLKGALVVPTTLLVSPYLYEYDLAALTLSLLILYRFRDQVAFGVPEYLVATVSAFALFLTPHIPPNAALPSVVLLAVYAVTARKLLPFRHSQRVIAAAAPSEPSRTPVMGSAARPSLPE